METQDLERVLTAAVKPQADLIAAWGLAIAKINARIAVAEIFAQAVMHTHPNPTKLGTAFAVLAVAADAGMPAELHGHIDEWDKAEGDVKTWIRQASRQSNDPIR